MNVATIDTPTGPFTVVAGADGAVLAAGFTTDTDALLALVHPSLRSDTRRWADLGPITSAVTSYLDGDVTAIDDVPVRQHTAGAFLARGWDVLRQVKAGAPISYTELAARTGRPAAVRAAAQACARNAAALFVPCHRVIRADRSRAGRALTASRSALGGYRWGLTVKEWLLAHETRMRNV